MQFREEASTFSVPLYDVVDDRFRVALSGGREELVRRRDGGEGTYGADELEELETG